MKLKLIVFGLISVLIQSCSNNDQITANKDQDQAPKPTVCTSCPTLGHNQDTLSYVEGLQRFLASKCDLGLMTHPDAKVFANYPINRFPVDQFLHYCETDSLAASVGMVSRMMQQILTENGIDSYVYRFGLNNNNHFHCVVLFKWNGKYCISDPYFNLTVKHSDQPLGVIELIDLIGQKRLDEIEVSSNPVDTDFLFNQKLASPGIIQLLNHSGCDQLRNSLVQLRDSTLKTRVPRCYRCDFENTCINEIAQFEESLEKETQLNSFFEGFVLKLEPVWGASDALEVDDIIETAIYSQPNLGKRARRTTIAN